MLQYGGGGQRNNVVVIYQRWCSNLLRRLIWGEREKIVNSGQTDFSGDRPYVVVLRIHSSLPYY